METILVNQVGRVSRAALNGRQYLVAPMTMIVPGVLNGSKGALYYPPDEVARDASIWNHIPITLFHPISLGMNVSARDPDVLRNQGIGKVFRSRINNEGKLQAEAWFDVESLRAADKRYGTDVLARLETNTPIELSTGLFTENVPAPQGANHRGRPYEWVARNYRPDHLAVLPNQTGACSINDGCGVLVNSTTAEWEVIKDMVDNKKKLPSKKADVSPTKACQILRDGAVHGSDLTEAQRGMFGAVCGQTKNSSTLDCPGCGMQMPAEAKYCSNCGRNLMGDQQMWQPVDESQIGKPKATVVKGADGRPSAGEARAVDYLKAPTKNEWQPIANTWSDEARQAAAESRRAHAATLKAKTTSSGHKISEESSMAKHFAEKPLQSQTENPVIAHDRAAKYHEMAASQHQAEANKGYADQGLHQKAADLHSHAAELHRKAWGGLTHNRDWPQSKRDKLNAKDFAGPDQSFPIATQEDLDAAIHSIGRAKDPEAVKAGIRRIAKKKGLKLPDTETWNEWQPV